MRDRKRIPWIVFVLGAVLLLALGFWRCVQQANDYLASWEWG